MAISIENKTITVATSRLKAVFEGPELVELRDPHGKLLAGRGGKALPALTLRFTQGETTPLCVSPYHEVSVLKLGERVAHVHVADENGDACLRLTVDEQDRLVVEPSAHTIRRNLCAVVWTLPAIAADLQLVAPFFQGCRQELTHPLVAGQHWEWPHRWEAGFVILQGAEGGFSVSSFDAHARPKAVAVGKDEQARSLAFLSEVHGPAHDSVAAGSLAWVLDTHEGDWQIPAGVYRDWLHRSVGAEALRRRRPAWAGNIRLALQWAHNDLAVLDAVAAVIAPEKVLIHQAGWRADPYDVNYPEYTAGAAGQAYLDKARAMGFHVMPHCNYCAIDPNHFAFPRLIDFVARQFGSQRLMAWRWKDGKCPAPPQGFGTLANLRDEKLMYYLHAGASAWRRLLAEQIAAAVARHQLTAIFVDQTLCTWNLDNALVENLSMVEGAVALTRELSELDGPLAVGGEGLNEMTMRYQSFAQAHLFNSHHHNSPHLAALDPVPVGDFLYGDLCKTMAYTNIDGKTPETCLRLEIHERLGALPSLQIGRPEQVLQPNDAVRHVLDRAMS